MAKKNKELKHVAAGHTFFLKPVNRAILLMTLSDSDKPKPPEREIKYAGNVTRKAPNRNDRQYQNSLNAWEAQYNSRMLRMCIVFGIDHVIENKTGLPAVPSDAKIAEIRFVYGDLTESEILYFYYAEIIGETERGFMNLVLGQTRATQEGLKKEEQRFRPDSEGSGVSGESDGLSPEAEMEDSSTD